MKVVTPEISWHNRAAILSVHFLNINNNVYKIVTGGIEKDIKIWKVSKNKDGGVQVDFASNLERHQNTVNVVRFSPNGVHLASGDSEGVVNVWKQCTSSAPNIFSVEKIDDDEDSQVFANSETWLVQNRFRDHKADCDICDLCWSPDSAFLLSCSVDCSVIVWNVATGKRVALIVENEKRFPVGVAWDPKSAYFVSLSNDKVMTVYSAEKFQRLFTLTSAELPSFHDPNKKLHFKLFYDSSLMSYIRRPAFTPNGDLFIAPAGCVEEEKTFRFCTYIFSRYSLKKPLVILPSKEPTISVACCPILFKLRQSSSSSFPMMISMPYRCVFAVLTKTGVVLYDTERQHPVAYISNIHYVNLTDCSWSNDGTMLIISSEDGYCTMVSFESNEFGEKFEYPTPTSSVTPASAVAATSTTGIKKPNVSKPKNMLKTLFGPNVTKSTAVCTSSATIEDNNSKDCIMLSCSVEEKPKVRHVDFVTLHQTTPCENGETVGGQQNGISSIITGETTEKPTKRRVSFVTLAQTPAGEDIAFNAITRPLEIL